MLAPPQEPAPQPNLDIWLAWGADQHHHNAKNEDQWNQTVHPFRANKFGQNLNLTLGAPAQQQQVQANLINADFMELNDLIGPHQLHATEFEEFPEMLNLVISNNQLEPSAPLQHIDLNQIVEENDSDTIVTFNPESEDSSHGLM